MTPKRLAEIEHDLAEQYSHTWMARDAHPGVCVICELLTALLEAERTVAKYSSAPSWAETDGLRTVVDQLEQERDALQRRVETLEKALSDMLNVYESMAKDVETLYDDWQERTEQAKATLRENGAG